MSKKITSEIEIPLNYQIQGALASLKRLEEAFGKATKTQTTELKQIEVSSARVGARMNESLQRIDKRPLENLDKKIKNMSTGAKRIRMTTDTSQAERGIKRIEDRSKNISGKLNLDTKDAEGGLSSLAKKAGALFASLGLATAVGSVFSGAAKDMSGDVRTLSLRNAKYYPGMSEEEINKLSLTQYNAASQVSSDTGEDLASILEVIDQANMANMQMSAATAGQYAGVVKTLGTNANDLIGALGPVTSSGMSPEDFIGNLLRVIADLGDEKGDFVKTVLEGAVFNAMQGITPQQTLATLEAGKIAGSVGYGGTQNMMEYMNRVRVDDNRYMDLFNQGVRLDRFVDQGSWKQSEREGNLQKRAELQENLIRGAITERGGISTQEFATLLLEATQGMSQDQATNFLNQNFGGAGRNLGIGPSTAVWQSLAQSQGIDTIAMQDARVRGASVMSIGQANIRKRYQPFSSGWDRVLRGGREVVSDTNALLENITGDSLFDSSYADTQRRKLQELQDERDGGRREKEDENTKALERLTEELGSFRGSLTGLLTSKPVDVALRGGMGTANQVRRATTSWIKDKFTVENGNKVKDNF